MKTTIEITGKTYQVSAKLIATGVRFPNTDDNDRTRHNKYRVTVKCDDGKLSFLYFGSDHDWNYGHDELNRNDLLGAVDCFLSDARSGDMSFENFCDELGYSDDSRRAFKIWKACVKAHEKASSLFGDVYAANEAIQEITNA